MLKNLFLQQFLPNHFLSRPSRNILSIVKKCFWIKSDSKCWQFKRKSHDGHSKIQERSIRRKQQQHDQSYTTRDGTDIMTSRISGFLDILFAGYPVYRISYFPGILFAGYLIAGYPACRISCCQNLGLSFSDPFPKSWLFGIILMADY